MHPSIRHFAPMFRFKHLPPHLAEVSAPFARTALDVARTLDGPEATVALRKLLEAKDAAVRAAGGFEATWGDVEADLAELDKD